MTTRMTREERRSQTRAALLAAAAAVFAERGYNGASVDQIAERAGLTSGALYSNFAGKEDLFFALFEERTERFAFELSEAVEGEPTVDARLTKGAGRWMAFLEREPELVQLFMEFWSYAVRNPAARERLAPRYAATRGLVAALIERSARELDVQLSLPPEELAIVVDALADGLALQRLADPGAVPDDLFARVLTLLFAATSS